MSSCIISQTFSQSMRRHSTNSPEHAMTDAVKVEPGSWDTDSSGGGQQAGGDASSGRLQPSGAALRKSQSALELGAWKKIAAGDMEFLDPSGSVREQLQGLDFNLVGGERERACITCI